MRKINERREMKSLLEKEYPQMPDSVRKAIAEEVSMQVQTHTEAGKTARKSRQNQWIRYTAGTAAAAAVVFSGVCITHPAFAAGIPGVGNVFADLGTSLGFGGNFEEYKTPIPAGDSASSEGVLASAANSASEDSVAATASSKTAGTASGAASTSSAIAARSPADGSSSYTQTMNGVSVTLEETYCNENALYISMTATSPDKAFPIDEISTLRGKPVIDIMAENTRLSYNPSARGEEIGLEGEFTDAHTYEGVIRINLSETLNQRTGTPADPSANQETGDMPSDTEAVSDSGNSASGRIALPKTFSVDLVIDKLVAYLKDPDYSNRPSPLEDYNNGGTMYAFPNADENIWVDGPWEFHFDVQVNPSGTRTRTLRPENLNGLTEITVTETPFDLQLSSDNPDAAYMVLATDAEGKMLEPGGFASGSPDTLSVKGHDVSKITIYVCDYGTYMDKIKGKLQANDRPSQVLAASSLWKQEVTFP